MAILCNHEVCFNGEVSINAHHMINALVGATDAAFTS